MKKLQTKILGVAFMAIFSAVFAWTQLNTENEPSTQELRAQRKANKTERKKARANYWQQMLQDPKTGKIPYNAQAKALYYTQKLTDASTARTEADIELDWANAGPDNIGGRIRAFAIDSRNSNVILAGGVTGGMWKSSNGGESWEFKSDPNKNLGVSSIAQDPSNPDTWYYSTGEVGSSASADDAGASFLGAGLFKSTDNGESWTFMGYEQGASNTEWKKSGDALQFPTDKPKNPFYETSRIRINPTTGAIFVASNYFGILRSTDGGENFTIVKVPDYTGEHYPDIAIDKQGNIVVSFAGIKDGDFGGGIFRSTDNGDTWGNITPSDFPSEFGRTVLAISASNSTILYSMTTTGQVVNGFDELYLYKHDLTAGTAENRASNIPTFPDANSEYNGLKTQGNYNMVIAVHPTDENMVFIGGTTLFRSSDGFATKSTDLNASVIGGYGAESVGTSNRFGDYINHFPDQHLMFFDPNNANIAYSMHDGGVSKTTDITASQVSWKEMDNNFAITQFYRVAISSESGDYRMAGGCQDNSSLFMNWQKGQSFTPATIMQGGDGATAYIGADFVVVSAQNASINFYPTKADKSPDIDFQDGFITPDGLQNKQFVHPFAVDTQDENMMYLPDGNEIWRNDKLKTKNGNEIFDSWSKMSGITSRSGTTISTLAMSQSPAGILYFGAFDANGGKPQIFKVDNAKSATSATEISVPDAPDGAYPVSIAVNPADANEIIVVFANYNITGLYHSTDGGQSYTAIEGNLTGTESLPGPSLRSASILNYDGKKVFYLGTSTGLFSTSNLNGGQTEWQQEAKSTLGSTVVIEVLTRDSDGFVAVGTHGRSNFIGLPKSAVVQPQAPSAPVATNATNISETEFTANWNAVSEATSYELDVSTSSNFDSFVAGYNAKEVSGTSENLTGLTENTDYFYRVRAKNADGISDNSNTISTKTNAPQAQAPSAPVATNATNISETEFTANWESVSEATSYELDVSTSSNFDSFVAGYNAKEVSGTSENLTGLTENTDYFYRVRAKNADGISDNSNTISTKTNAPQAQAPSAPVATNATNISETEFTANWESVSEATSYELDVSTSSNFGSFVAGYDGKEVSGTSENLTGLTESTDYFYRVRAKNTDGTSGNSNTISATTLETVVSGIEDEKNTFGIKLFPNPTTDFMQINIENTAYRNQPIGCQIFDVNGRVIFTKTADINKLNQSLKQVVSGLTKGAYFMSLKIDEVDFQTRFIKQ